MMFFAAEICLKKCVPTRRKQREREQRDSLKLDHSPSIFFICSMTARGCATTDLEMGSGSSPVFGSVSNFLVLTSAREAGLLVVVLIGCGRIVGAAGRSLDAL